MIHERYYKLKKEQEKLLKRKNKVASISLGFIDRYKNPILTKDHFPIEFRFDLSKKDNPYFLERQGVNATFNSGAIYFKGEYYLMVRVEGIDRKSIFMVAKSKSPIDNFRFTDTYVDITNYANETNVYDMRLTYHEDGYIYGMFCSESKDPKAPLSDTSSAIANTGILRTKDMINFERLPNLVSKAQERNVTLHPYFVDGKYLLYTRPQDDFINPGQGEGIASGFVSDMTNPILIDEKVLDERKYHTVYEVKNGCGASPIKTDEGFIHIAHGVRNTACGLRYVIYAFMTDLNNPRKVIYKPAGYLLAPEGEERIGDVSNVLFTNGLVENGDYVYLYYASSDTRMHVAKMEKAKLIDYLKNSPKDGFCAKASLDERFKLINKNKELLGDQK